MDFSSLVQQVIDLFEAITPAIPIVLPAYLAFMFGVQKSRNDILIKRRLEIAESLGGLIQTIIKSNHDSEFFYDGLFQLSPSFTEVIGTIERLRNLYLPNIQRIIDGEESFRAMYQTMQIARLYIPKRKLDPISEYLELW